MNKEQIMSTFNKVNIKLRKHSPEIFLAVGVIGTVASTVMACKATTKINDILDETKKNVDTIHKYNDGSLGDRYTPNDARKDLAIVYAQTGVELAKLYGPAVVVGAASIAAIVGSHQILRKRNAALVAAYVAVDNAFKGYRNRVVERFGEQVDVELKNNIKAKQFQETTVDPESGKEKKVKKTVDVAEPDEYSLFFDEASAAYEKNSDYNLMFLKAQQQFANDKLRVDGFLFLNDVYDMLGLQRTKRGQIVGWIYKPGENANGDNFVDFGILETNRGTEDGGYKPAILLNFNVDGPILDLI